MKRLTDSKMFASSPPVRITMTEFRKTPGEVIMRTQMGQRFVVTKAGKPVATVEPYQEKK